MDYRLVNSLHSLEHGTQVKYKTDDPKREVLEMLIARTPEVSGPPDLLNRCAQPPCDRPDATPTERAVERELQGIAAVKGPWVALLPEASLLRVRVDGGGANDLVYSLVHNDSHTNVAMMFDEAERRVRADDTVTVVRGHYGSYPNFFFEVTAEQIGTFTTALRSLTNDANLEAFVDTYGIRRTDARFWATSDFMRRWTNNRMRSRKCRAFRWQVGRLRLYFVERISS
jgi:hypothetical protein